MFAVIDNKVYEMDQKTFKNTRETVRESKVGKYSIYCLYKSAKALFINEEFKNKDELRKQVAKYTQNGFRVFFTTVAK